MKFKKDIMYGQEVVVTVYESSTKKPRLATDKYLAELPGASAQRVKEIQQIADQYSRNVLEYEMLLEDDDDNFLILEDDEDNLEAEGYGIVEEYRPLDELLTEERFQSEEEERLEEMYEG